MSYVVEAVTEVQDLVDLKVFESAHEAIAFAERAAAGDYESWLELRNPQTRRRATKATRIQVRAFGTDQQPIHTSYVLRPRCWFCYRPLDEHTRNERGRLLHPKPEDE